MQAGYAAPHCHARGGVRNRQASPAGASLWLLQAELDADATLAWNGSQGDEALFVERGALSWEGRLCPAGGVVVVESRARTTLRSVGPSRIVHLGPQDATPPIGGLYGPADPPGGGVHVVGPRGTFESRGEGRDSHFFADATCPSCRLWLLHVSRSVAYESAIHSHSQDELIHLLRGEIVLGSLRLGPGSTVFIAADQPYRFRGGEHGFAFLNYRRDASEMTVRSTGEKLLEAGRARGLSPVPDSRGSQSKRWSAPGD